jgi:hypothetical protein
MRHTLTLLVSFLTAPVWAQTNVDFQDLPLPGPNTAYYGQDNAGGFTSRGTFFNNQYTDFGGGFFVWDGFAYSNIVDTTTSGFGNQFAAYHLPGGDGTNKYGVGFSFNYEGTTVVDSFPRITLPAGTRPLSVQITNTTYAALAMLNGDGFSKKFGGASGNDPDFLQLVIQCRDAANAITGTVPFLLADYRFSNNALDYVVSQWTTLDLSSLPASTQALTFELTSTDVGEFGINTPAYFALDNLMLAVPEPGTWALLASASFAGGVVAWRKRRQMQV